MCTHSSQDDTPGLLWLRAADVSVLCFTLQIQAADAIEDDANVRQRLGQVAVGLPSNISKQTIVING